jgi:hypothetical protein
LTIQSLPDLIPRYVDAWNDPDLTRRRAGLASLYEGDGQIVTQSGVFAGMGAITQHVGQVYEEFIAPGRYRFVSGGAVGHHDCVLFRWEMRESGAGELVDAGMNLFLLSAAGLIASDYQFALGADSSIGSAGRAA